MSTLHRSYKGTLTWEKEMAGRLLEGEYQNQRYLEFEVDPGSPDMDVIFALAHLERVLPVAVLFAKIFLWQGRPKLIIYLDFLSRLRLRSHDSVRISFVFRRGYGSLHKYV